MGLIHQRRPATPLFWVVLLPEAATVVTAGEEPEVARFQEIVSDSGLHFALNNHTPPAKRYIETMAGGLAAFDYDNNGLIDIFFTNGAAIPSLRKESSRYHNRLFRNLGEMKFADVTDRAGLAGEGPGPGSLCSLLSGLPRFHSRQVVSPRRPAPRGKDLFAKSERAKCALLGERFEEAIRLCSELVTAMPGEAGLLPFRRSPDSCHVEAMRNLTVIFNRLGLCFSSRDVSVSGDAVLELNNRRNRILNVVP